MARGDGGAYFKLMIALRLALVVSLLLPVVAAARDHEVARQVMYGGACVGCDLSGRKMLGGRFYGANFSNAVLTAADLRGAAFRGAAFGGADLSDADARGATLLGSNFDSAKFRRAHLEGLIAKGAQFSHADFTNDLELRPRSRVQTSPHSSSSPASDEKSQL